MISNNIYNFCKEDISLIENYENAINDNTQIWICHHRLGIDLGLSREELIEKDLYFNRPANELLFLTRADHFSIHSKNRIVSEETRKKMSEAKQNGFIPWNKDKKVGPLSEEQKQKISKSLKGKKSYTRTEEHRKKQSESHKGQIAWNKDLPPEKQPTFGKTWKLKFKRGWKINPDTGKREYFRVE